jgi:hypothetical protein
MRARQFCGIALPLKRANSMTGTILVLLISGVAFYMGVPLAPLLIFIVLGTLIEHKIIKKNEVSTDSEE